MKRDFTYIDDIVEGIFRCCYKPAYPEKKSSSAPFRIFNIGNGRPIELMEFIKVLEKELGVVSMKEFLDMQIGDVVETWASTEALNKWINYRPSTKIDYGVKKFIQWYRDFYDI